MHVDMWGSGIKKEVRPGKRKIRDVFDSPCGSVVMVEGVM